MFFLKTCPRCRGDMYLENDRYGDYRKCAQCGHIVELEGDAGEEVGATVTRDKGFHRI
jgi:hypothetical protein